MKRKPSPARCRKHAATEPQPECRKSRLVQRRYLRLGRTVKPVPPHQVQPALAVSDALQAAFMTSWKGLPERCKHQLNAGMAAGNQGEEAALSDLARLLMDCAGVLFKQALTARHNRFRD